MLIISDMEHGADAGVLSFVKAVLRVSISSQASEKSGIPAMGVSNLSLT